MPNREMGATELFYAVVSITYVLWPQIVHHVEFCRSSVVLDMCMLAVHATADRPVTLQPT